MRSECYMYLEGYGSRDLRGLSELLICWACRDKLDEYGFYEDPSCREEGLRGPLGEAEDALRHMHMHMCMCMYDAVRGDDVLEGSIEKGYRKGNKWERKILARILLAVFPETKCETKNCRRRLQDARCTFPFRRIFDAHLRRVVCGEPISPRLLEPPPVFGRAPSQRFDRGRSARWTPTSLSRSPATPTIARRWTTPCWCAHAHLHRAPRPPRTARAPAPQPWPPGAHT